MFGWVTPNEVKASFKDCVILLMPSSAEGIPIVGVRALAMGLALVGSRVCGFVDIIEQGENGLMYPPENIEAMQKVLRQLISSPEMLLEFRRHSMESAQRFGINRVVDDYIQIFEKVATG